LRLAEGWRLRCIGCGSTRRRETDSFTCPRCGELTELVLEGSRPEREDILRAGDISVWKYGSALPVKGAKPVTLGEGGTPLVKSARLSESTGIDELYFKNEGQNPTGSFKDRGMTVAVTRAVQLGARVLICASTGNTSASLAAYSARAGLSAVVLVPSGKVATGKLVQAVSHGATIVRVSGNFDRALELTLRAAGKGGGLYVMNSINPYRIEGQKTVAYEIYEQLGSVPDYVVMPVGNAGNISAAWKGFKELRDWGIADRVPGMIGVQASGASPIARAVESGADRVVPVRRPSTVASAIRIGKPVSWRKALNAIRESGGGAVTVTDEQITRARSELASKEGIFVESASAAPVAALGALKGRMGKGDVVVCIVTGHGLKEQETIQWNTERLPLARNWEELARTLREH
jgi:threonine synthase